MADTHSYTLKTYNSNGDLIAEVTVSCDCPKGADHTDEIKP